MRECGCSRITDNYLCQTCENHLNRLIRRTPWLIHELGTNAARQNKTSTGGNQESKTASKNRPDLVNFAAMQLAHELTRTLSWSSASHLARHPMGPERYNDLKYLHERATRIIDIKPERVHLGTCPTEGCTQPLNVPKGETAHKCGECGETIDIKAHKDERIGRATAITCWPPEVVQFIHKMGHRLTVKDIQNWVARGKLASAGEYAGRPTYRVGDVWQLVKVRDGVKDEEEMPTV